MDTRITAADIRARKGRPPARFVRRDASLKADATAAVSRFADDVRQGRYPSSAEPYGLHEEAGNALQAVLVGAAS